VEARQHPSPVKKEARDISLYGDDILAARKSQIAAEDVPAEQQNDKRTPVFSITNPAYENQRLLADPEWKEMNEERIKEMMADPYINVAYQLISPLIK
jgi:hypothetical protein